MSRSTALLIAVAGIVLSIVISLATRSFFVLLLIPLFFWGGTRER
jgi:hypothetical protein